MRQARQELHHARVFNRVVLVITPRGATPVPDSLRQYRARLKSAYRKGRLVETLVGQQIVLEEFGALILQRLDTKFDQRRLGFKRIRKILLHQEQGHIAFGARAVRGLIEMGEARLEEVEELVSEYMDLIDQTIDGLQPMFEVIGADAQLYKNELRRGLPDWCEVLN